MAYQTNVKIFGHDFPSEHFEVEYHENKNVHVFT